VQKTGKNLQKWLRWYQFVYRRNSCKSITSITIKNHMGFIQLTFILIFLLEIAKSVNRRFSWHLVGLGRFRLYQQRLKSLKIHADFTLPVVFFIRKE